MHRSMLAVSAVLAAVAVAGPTAVAQSAISKAKVTQGYVYGGVVKGLDDLPGYPVVIQLSRNGKRVVRASIGLHMKCQTPGDLTLPDFFQNLPITAGKFRLVHGPTPVDGDPANGVSKVIVSGFIKGRVNRAHTQIKGTWNLKVVAISAADPTGATILDTCDSGVVSYTADQ